MKKRKLFIDVGHTLKWGGAVGIKREIDWNRAVFPHIYNGLNALERFEIVLVPTSFVTDWSANRNLINRIRWINKHSEPRDLLLSLHGNAATSPRARGVTTVYMGGSYYAKTEAIKMSEEYSKATGVPVWHGGAFSDRNSRFGRIGMVRDTSPIALMAEMGFVTNKEDMAIDPKKAAEGIVNYYANSDF